MKKNSKGIIALSSAFMNDGYDATNLEQAYDKIKELASTASKQSSREEIAEIVGYVVDSVINQRLNFIDMIADVKRVAQGDKAEFKLKYGGIKATLAAKSSTPEISKIRYKKTIVPTVEVQSRPSIDYLELVNNPETVMEVIEDAVVEMENQVVTYVQSVLNTAYSSLSTPNYVSGAGVVKTTFDPQVRAMSRFGKPVILGDIEVATKLTALTAFNSNVADALAIEHNTNGVIGTYLNANVVQLTNRYADDTSLALTNLVSDYDKLYVLPAGARDSRPLKVVYEGSTRAMEQLNAEDESWEIFLRMNFGVEVIGIQLLMAIYNDTTL